MIRSERNSEGNARSSNDDGDGRGDFLAWMAKCTGIRSIPGSVLLIVTLIIFAGIGLLPTSSCSRPAILTSTSAPTSAPRNDITMEKYDQVQTGMSYREVIDILGPPDKGVSSGEMDGMTYLWGSTEAGSIRIIFKNDRVVGKSQSGIQ